MSRRRDWPVTIGASAGTSVPLGALSAAAALEAGAALHRLPPLSELTRAVASAHLPGWLSQALNLPEPAYAALWLSQFAPAWHWWAAAGAALGICIGASIGWLAGSVAEIKAERGRSVARGHAAARAEAAIETKVSGPGIHIHPQLQISRDRETRGIQLTGSPGSGKTVIIVWLLQQILRDPGARILIHDIKGDFTSRIFSILDEDERVALVAPWDQRSVRWSAAADIRSTADARELAARLIPAPSSGNAQWAQGAQMILAGLIVTLAKKTKGRWTWGDLQDEIARPYPQMRAAAVFGAPMAAGLLNDEESPSLTTASYLANLTAAAGGLITDLASADITGRGSWHARGWLAGKGPRIVIMQGSTRFSELARAVNSSIIRAIAGSLDSMPDSSTRRVWLLLDELAQLGKVELAPIIETGRSKGFCIVSGWQDRSQRRAIYGRDTADAWDSMTGTHVICRLLGPDSQQWASALVGRRQVRRQIKSVAGDPSSLGSRSMASARNVSISEQIADEDVIRPEEWADLGPCAAGVEAILVSGGQTVHRMTWPFPNGWKEVAPPHEPAAWTKSLEADAARESAPEDPAPQARSAMSGNGQQTRVSTQTEIESDLPSDEPAPALTPVPTPTVSLEDDTQDEQFIADESPADEVVDEVDGLVTEPAAPAPSEDPQPRRRRLRLRPENEVSDGA